MCNFNAVELLQQRRKIARDTAMDPETAKENIDLIDDMRWHHEEKTGCTCWQDAIAANPSEFSLLAEYQATKEQVITCEK